MVKKDKKTQEKKPEKKNPLVRLDLACGLNKQKGYIGVDKVKTPGTDIVHDLETYPWPFPDNYADQVVISHYIEHVQDLPKFMNELYRVMKKGSNAYILAPYYTSIRAWQDPTHVRPISEASFIYYNKAWRKKARLSHYDIKCDFDFTYGLDFSPDWANRSEEAKDFAARHYNNVVQDIRVLLVKR